MFDYNSSPPIQCRCCRQCSAYPSAEGYLCEECDYLLSWGFFKVAKLKCGCEQCQQDLGQAFWKKVPPFQLGQDYQDFQI